MADVGFGVETPARQFKLDFVPIQTERYFLLCEERSLDTPAVRKTLEIVGSAEFKAAVDRLPGYQSNDAGSVMTLRQAFSSSMVPSTRRGARLRSA